MTTSTTNFQAALKAARRVSTPLIAVQTFDPANAAQAVLGSLPKDEPVALLRWDIMRGIGPINEAGKAVVAQLVNGQNPEMIGPSDALGLGARLPEDAILIANNFHRFWNDPVVMQGIWNLRDAFKVDGRTLLMMVSPGASRGGGS